ncbi:hypothetical protein EH223_10485 [candidate division KSB1 bacterium]|nr:hypothetical protein [candidate division KSB1 bacterium]RQW03261.1 MAG: hypothetical protein EH223_10485 [candidate division KSB1 bacterium]
MKRAKVFSLFFVCAVLVTTPAFAVSEAAILSLLLSPSPQANAMGESYGLLWGTDPMSSTFNPAALGLQAQKTFLGYAIYPEKVYWLPYLSADLWYNSKAINAGYNLYSLTKIPLSIGVGYFDAYLHLGEQFYTDEPGDPLGSFISYEKYNSTTFSVAIDYYLHASFGYTIKNIDATIGAGFFENGAAMGRAQPNAHDWGVVIRAPVFDILKKLQKPTTFYENLCPYLTPGFHYSKRNIGDKVIFIDEAQADPLPRQAYIGASFETGLRYQKAGSQLDIIHFGWAREMDDVLVDRNVDGTWTYLSGLNDIKFWDNVICGRTNNKATKHQGYEIGLAGIGFFRRGLYQDIEGLVFFKTRGYGLNFTQPFRLLAALFDYQRDKLWLNILLSLDVEYYESHFIAEEGHPIFGTGFRGVTIKLRNFEF